MDDDGTVLLADFGVTTELELQASKKRSTFAGTAHYMAPEVVKGKYDHRADIWSVGITIMEMYMGKPPAADMPQTDVLVHKIRGAPPTLASSGASTALKKLVSECLQVDPAKRPTVEGILAGKFLSAHAFQGSSDANYLCKNLVPKVLPVEERAEHRNKEHLLAVERAFDANTGYWSFGASLSADPDKSKSYGDKLTVKGDGDTDSDGSSFLEEGDTDEEDISRERKEQEKPAQQSDVQPNVQQAQQPIPVVAPAVPQGVPVPTSRRASDVAGMNLSGSIVELRIGESNGVKTDVKELIKTPDVPLGQSLSTPPAPPSTLTPQQQQQQQQQQQRAVVAQQPHVMNQISVLAQRNVVTSSASSIPGARIAPPPIMSSVSTSDIPLQPVPLTGQAAAAVQQQGYQPVATAGKWRVYSAVPQTPGTPVGGTSAAVTRGYPPSAQTPVTTPSGPLVTVSLQLLQDMQRQLAMLTAAVDTMHVMFKSLAPQLAPITSAVGGVHAATASAVPPQGVQNVTAGVPVMQPIAPVMQPTPQPQQPQPQPTAARLTAPPPPDGAALG